MTNDVQQTSHNILQLFPASYLYIVASHGGDSIATLASLSVFPKLLTCSVKSALYYAVTSHGICLFGLAWDHAAEWVFY